MRRFGFLLRRTFENSASVMLIYRENLIFFLVFEVMFLATQFLVVKVGFDLAGGAVAGWSREEAYALTAINGLSHQLFICFFINAIFSLGLQVWNGQYDYILLKPLPPLLSMFFNGQFVISNLPTLLLNVGVVVWLVATSQPEVTVSGVVGFVALLVAGVAVRVGLALFCMAPVFFSERLTDVENSFWSLQSLGRYPMTIYPRALERTLTFFVPLAMMASVPSGFLFGRYGWSYVLGALGASVLFVYLAVRFFGFCLGRYQSVNAGV